MNVYVLVMEVESDPYTFALHRSQMDLHFATAAIEINIRGATESHGWCRLFNDAMHLTLENARSSSNRHRL
jgi:hypothetical protein